MKKDISAAKITKPSIAGVFPRERLFRILDDSRRRPIVWLSGPAGSGKTTLVASYLDSRNLPCLWYRMDQGDADIATFFYYLGLAANKETPLLRNLPLLTPEYLHGIPVFTRRFFEQLCRGLASPFILVFDNYQDVPDASGFHDMIAHGLDAIPEGITVILISRKEPPARFSRLRAGRKIELVGWEDIRFTLDEFRGASSRFGLDAMTDESLMELHGKTQGWMAGLVLLMEGSKRKNLDLAVLNTLIPETIFDYFAGEIFEKTERAMRDFLLRTAVLPVMTAGIAEKLTGIRGAEEKLTRLHRSHYFVEMRTHDDPAYYYHPLFREFLLSKAKRVFTDDELSSILRTAAALLKEEGQIEQAALLMQEARDWKGLVSLILEHAERLIMQGRGMTILEWFRVLPGEVVERTPWVLYWMGMCSMPISLAESRIFFEQAYSGFKDNKDPRGLYLSWSGIISTFIYEWGDFSPADRWINEFESLSTEYPDYGSPEIEARVTHGMFSVLMYRQPQHPDLSVWEQRLKNSLLSSTDVRLQTMIGSQLIVYYAWANGDLGKLTFLLNATKSTAESRKTDPLSFIIWCSFEAAYYWMTASHEQCLRAVNDALETAESSGIHLWDAIPCAVGVMTHTTLGNFREAKAYLEKMSATMNPNAFVTVSLYHDLAVFIALFQGDVTGALEHARTAVHFAKKSGVPYALAISYFALGAVLLECDEGEQGETYLEKARTTAYSINSNTAAYLSAITKAQYLLQRNKEGAGMEALAEAMTIGRKYGFVNHSAWRSSVMAFLCAKALEAGIEVEYVQELIRKRDLVPDDSAAAPDTWPWPIRIYALGHFRIEKDGAPLTFSGKVQKKPLELLKLLIALGGRDISETKLTDALWPDAEGDAAHRAFVTTLQRLRKLLGSKEVIRLQEGRLSFDPRYCWVDALAFEGIVRKADEAWKAETKKQAILITEKAVALYGGPLLGQDGDDLGIAAIRDSFRKKFVRCLGVLGHHAENSGEWEKALSYYDRVSQPGDSS